MSISKKINDGNINLIKGDLTALDVESIVFYAQDNLKLGSGFGNAIAMRGGISIQKELETLGVLPSTQAVVTKGGSLNAKFIVHANGPKFQEAETEAKLAKTIMNALLKAEEQGISQIAFPPMGSGFYGIPIAVCAKIMTENFLTYLNNSPKIKEIIVCAADNREFKPFEEALAKL